MQAALVVAAAAIFAALFIYGVSRTKEANHDDQLPAYMPADTAAFVSINARELWTAPIVKKLDAAGTVDHLAGNGRGANLCGLLRHQPEKDIDQLRVIYGTATFDRPLYWTHGRFDTDSAYLVSPQLQRIETDRFPGFTFYHTENAVGPATTLATDGHTLLCCQDSDRIFDALHEALAGCQPELREEGFREMFGKVDQQQTVWFVAAMTPFRGLKPSLDLESEAVLRPFFMHAKFVYGGIQLKDDALAVIHVRTEDDNNAEQFAEQINQLQRLAQTYAEQETTPNKLRPLVRCLAESTLDRNGREFTLQFRLTADMVK